MHDDASPGVPALAVSLIRTALLGAVKFPAQNRTVLFSQPHKNQQLWTLAGHADRFIYGIELD
jgi:hypothetical protein